MATLLKAGERRFEENQGKTDPFRIFSDVSRVNSNVSPQNLNFDLRQLPPGRFSAPYHFHRYAEELFMILSGSATLRTPEGFEVVGTGDLIFFEMGERGAHQLYNHTSEPCTFLDVRSYIGHDVCEYPDSHKILLAPSFEIFGTEATRSYFDGEENVEAVWRAKQGIE